MPLPFSLARTLPRSPLRSDNGHRNRDGSLRSPIPSSLCSSLRPPFNTASLSAQKIRSFGSSFLSRAHGGDNGSAPPMTRFSRQSGCTRLRLDTFVSRHSLTAIAVRRLPLSPPVSTEFEHHKDGIYFRQRCCGLCGIQVKKESNEKTVDLFLFRTYFIIISHTICLN